MTSVVTSSEFCVAHPALCLVAQAYRSQHQQTPRQVKRVHYLGFTTHKQIDSGTHNPLVPGSSPGGPTTFHKFQGLMSLRPRDWPSPIIPWSRVDRLAHHRNH